MVELVIRSVEVVVEEHQLTHSGLGGQVDGVVDAGVAERRPLCLLFRRVLRSVSGRGLREKPVRCATPVQRIAKFSTKLQLTMS